MDEDKVNKLINAAQLAFAEILDTDLYLPMKQELMQHDITHSLGFKKEQFKSKVERLFEDLKKELIEL
ncbi:hypothetical protein KKF61_08635 [Patescibacteria group bacterium]|nr:hypothetical protein [Patescibacteria group bacterium]